MSSSQKINLSSSCSFITTYIEQHQRPWTPIIIRSYNHVHTSTILTFHNNTLPNPTQPILLCINTTQKGNTQPYHYPLYHKPNQTQSPISQQNYHGYLARVVSPPNIWALGLIDCPDTHSNNELITTLQRRGYDSTSHKRSVQVESGYEWRDTM